MNKHLDNLNYFDVNLMEFYDPEQNEILQAGIKITFFCTTRITVFCEEK